MGQLQNRPSDKAPTEGKETFSQPIKDRTGAKFQDRTRNVVNPKATGTGKSGNPGRPV